jgi:nucleotide-binding universal stress UspA family protein
MYTTIVVPLDGSPFAERALPLALALARRMGASVELLHVDEGSWEDVSHPRGSARGARDALDALRGRYTRLAGRLATSTHVPVVATVLTGPPVDAIRRHVEDDHTGLIVMATHGEGRLGRLWLGSVAEPLVRHLRTPVLLVRPGAMGTASLEVGAASARIFRRVLVPLDGSVLAEAVLPHALSLGDDDHTGYTLVTVVTAQPARTQPFPSRTAPRQQEQFEQAAVAEAERYLTNVADEMRQCGGTISTRVLVHSDAARAILDLAHEGKFDLITLSTHGRGALKALWFGSVADEILRGARVPLLLLRPAELPARADAPGVTPHSVEFPSL